MFRKDQLNIFDWFFFDILVAIPIVNIIVFLVILFNDESNPTLRSRLWYSVLMTIIVIGGVIYFVTNYPEQFQLAIQSYETYQEDLINRLTPYIEQILGNFLG